MFARRSLPFFASIAVLAPLVAGCGSDTESRAQERKAGDQPRMVEVVPAERSALPDVVAVSGTLAAQDTVVLGTKVAGRLVALPVDLGSVVRQGQVLARLAPTDFELRVRQADAALEQAKARLGLRAGEGDAVDRDSTAVVKQAKALLTEATANRARAQALFDQQLLPKADLDAANAAYEVAEGRFQEARDEALNRQGVLAQRRSELDLARQQLADSVIVAPFSGAVAQRHATAGQFVAAGEPVVTLVRTNPLRLQLAVPERAAGRVRIGQQVRVIVEGDPRSYGGRVARVSPAIDQSDRTLKVEADVPNADGALRAGSFVNAEIVTAADRPVVLVPASSIVAFAGIEKVLTVEAGKTAEVRVRSGRKTGDRVEVVEGLNGGEFVVLTPGNLAGGQAVTVQNSVRSAGG
ncbi:MAG TPA: efflux RND transporter periplasmic adaptor subunit [Thermoanaerobaculia bacterium]|jgi:RND family efflux transporter MFP subunit|nr:efflux RND transporter periplasmic adaptor subunit [Thermoanaerobaculia bacterium]